MRRGGGRCEGVSRDGEMCVGRGGGRCEGVSKDGEIWGWGGGGCTCT